jgi:hypothetical protein
VDCVYRKELIFKSLISTAIEDISMFVTAKALKTDMFHSQSEQFN